MKGMRCLGWTGLAALALPLADPAQAQPKFPKSGKFSVHYGWKQASEVRDLGNGVLIVVGEDHGALFNDAGSGFIHNSAVTCPQTGYVGASGFVFRGNCYITDADGDMILLVWECGGPAKGPGPQEGRCAGTEWLFGGTGKYSGITGTAEFHGGYIGKGPHGFGIWKGEYRIP